MSGTMTVPDAGGAAFVRQSRRAENQLKPIVRRLTRQPSAVVGAAVLLLLVIGAVFAPVLTPYDPARLSPREALQPPNLVHPLGTDHFGRDQLTRVLYGGQTSLQIGLYAVAFG